MVTNEEIIARNIEKLKALINLDVGSATVGGIIISRVDLGRCKYQFSVGGFVVYADDIAVITDTVRLTCGGYAIAFLSLKGE